MLGRLACSAPVRKKVMAGAWLTCSVCIDLMKHSSSATDEVCGRKLHTQAPLRPYRANLVISGSTGLEVWPLVIVLSRLPPWIAGGISLPRHCASLGL